MISCSLSTSALAASRSTRNVSRSTRSPSRSPCNRSTALCCASNIDITAASRAWSWTGLGSGALASKSIRRLYLPSSSSHGIVSSTRQYWRSYWLWSHPLPVQSLQQQPQLRRTQANHAVLHWRPDKPALLQALVEQAQTGPVPGQDLDPIRPLGPEHEEGAGERVLAQRLLHSCGQAVQTVAEIDRPARHHDAHSGRQRDHASSRTICSTRRRSPVSNPVPRRIVIPSAITSIRPL